MSHALVITQNQRIISDFEKFTAVTESELVVSIDPSSSDIKNAYRIFLDQDVSGLEISHSEIVLVVDGALDSTTWQQAMRCRAIYVAQLSQSRDWLVEHLVAPAENAGPIVACVPAVGGAGASYLAVALAAQACHSNATVTLIDADNSSIGIDVLCGAEETLGSRWADLAHLDGGVSGLDIRATLPTMDSFALLSADARGAVRILANAKAIIEELGHVSDVTIVDCGRIDSPETQAIVELADYVFLVVPSTVRGCAAANQALNGAHSKKFTVVLRQIPGSGLNALTISDTLGVPVFTQIPTDQRIVEQVEQGFGLGNVNLGGFTRSIQQLTTKVLDEPSYVIAA